ncbi:hypothetical protein GE09DRAFT_91795 [Coniochaeta sp. 2T2.1]|nr:hypothetical protein GE09DRAFT_91795 [Coniochaeta sp. 2T2.1]
MAYGAVELMLEIPQLLPSASPCSVFLPCLFFPYYLLYVLIMHKMEPVTILCMSQGLVVRTLWGKGRHQQEYNTPFSSSHLSLLVPNAARDTQTTTAQHQLCHRQSVLLQPLVPRSAISRRHRQGRLGIKGSVWNPRDARSTLANQHTISCRHFI